MRVGRIVNVGLVSIACLACERADLTAPPDIPRQKVVAGQDGPGIDDLDPSSRNAMIQSKYVTVSWSGAAVNSLASMDYFGNRATVDLHLSVQHGFSTVGSTSASTTDVWFWPWYHTLTLEQPFQTTSACGQVANANGSFSAKIMVVVDYAWAMLGQAYGTASGSAGQPACEEKVPTSSGGSGGGGSAGGNHGGEDTTKTVTCYVFILYYEDTGEVISVTFLGCY